MPDLKIDRSRVSLSRKVSALHSAFFYIYEGVVLWMNKTLYSFKKLKHKVTLLKPYLQNTLFDFTGKQRKCKQLLILPFLFHNSTITRTQTDSDKVSHSNLNATV